MVMQRLFTVKEASEALHVSPSLVYTLARRGRLASVRIAPHVIRIPEIEIQKMIDSAYDHIKVD